MPGLLRDPVPVRVEEDDAGLRALELPVELLLGEDERGPGVPEDVPVPLRRLLRVQRDVGAARFEDPPEPDRQLERSLQAEPDRDLRPHPLRPEEAGQLGRPGVERPIGQGLVFEPHRHPLGRVLGLLAGPLVHQRQLAPGRLQAHGPSTRHPRARAAASSAAVGARSSASQPV